MLFLGMAHKYGHEMLAPIARILIAGTCIDHISVRDRQDGKILRRVVLEMIAAPDVQVDLVKALVQSADLGLARIEMRTQEIPPEIHERILRIVAAAGGGEDLPEDKISQIPDVVTFLHRGENGSEFELPVRHQSSGTITWLTTAWHALDALRQGSVLLVDELDASLHPELGRYIVKLFLDSQLNEKGAQLIFTSHDASLLGIVPTKILELANVWFVEKNESGHSELYSLTDFDNRSGNNSEQRYLTGQFGAIPDIDDRIVRRYIAASSGGSRG